MLINYWNLYLRRWKGSAYCSYHQYKSATCSDLMVKTSSKLIRYNPSFEKIAWTPITCCMKSKVHSMCNCAMILFGLQSSRTVVQRFTLHSLGIASATHLNRIQPGLGQNTNLMWIPWRSPMYVSYSYIHAQHCLTSVVDDNWIIL